MTTTLKKVTFKALIPKRYANMIRDAARGEGMELGDYLVHLFRYKNDDPVTPIGHTVVEAPDPALLIAEHQVTVVAAAMIATGELSDGIGLFIEKFVEPWLRAKERSQGASADMQPGEKTLFKMLHQIMTPPGRKIPKDEVSTIRDRATHVVLANVQRWADEGLSPEGDRDDR